jgi:hypothetical protein
MNPPVPQSDDQKPHDFQYGHGRMPLFLKIAWVGFLIFATYYIVVFLLNSLGVELGG